MSANENTQENTSRLFVGYPDPSQAMDKCHYGFYNLSTTFKGMKCDNGSGRQVFEDGPFHADSRNSGC